jgi:hypothetical protein
VIEKTIDDYLNDGYKPIISFTYSSNLTNKETRPVIVYGKGSNMVFYDLKKGEIIYSDTTRKK